MSRPTGETELTPLEIATGLVFGDARGAQTKGGPVRGSESPLAALERALVPALQRPPCLVSFSGGRDSSCVLAAATHVARRRGLPLPIPATNRFARARATAETEWQELVVAHLGLTDWLKVEFGDELDAVGPFATRLLRRHGLLWPFNTYFHAPLLEAARGGSLLTGIGGDEVFGESSWARVNDVLARRLRPEPRDLLRVGVAFAPLRVRRRVLARRAPAGLPWLRPAAARALSRAWADQVAAESRGYANRLAWWRGLRSVQLGFRSLELLALDNGAEIAHPLADPAFGPAIARTTRRDGPVERGAFMAEVFGDLLPPVVYRRRTKASFDEAFWGRYARQLAARWQGEGADPELVDVAALRDTWSSPTPDSHSFSLLQAAWLRLEARKAPREPVPQPEPAGPSPEGASAPMPAAPRA